MALDAPARTDRPAAPPPGTDDSVFASVHTPRVFNAIAVTTAILWLVGSLGSVISVVDQGDADVWDLVVAATAAGEYLIVTVLAMAASSILTAIQADRSGD